MKKWLSHIKKIFSKRSTEREFPLELSSLETAEIIPWWGNFKVPDEQSHFAKIGDLVFCLDHLHQAWHLVQFPDKKETQKRELKTVVISNQNEDIKLSPLLADRAILIPLESPLLLSPGSEKVIYTSTPVWMNLEIGQPPLVSEEIHATRFSDTWDGRTTLEGELCYASSHYASSNLEDLPIDNAHVLTPISIFNFDYHSVSLKTLKLPLPFLSIFSDPQHRLWTEELNLVFEDHYFPEMRILTGPPLGLKNSLLLRSPRFDIKTSLKTWFHPFRRL
jgi:hypothetical protein